MVSLTPQDNGLNLEDKLNAYNNSLKALFEKKPDLLEERRKILSERNVKILNEIKENFKVISYTYNVLSFMIAVYSKNYEGFLDAQCKIYNDNKVGSFQYIHESEFDKYEFTTFGLDDKISFLFKMQNIELFYYDMLPLNIKSDKLPDSQINFNDFRKKFDEIDEIKF